MKSVADILRANTAAEVQSLSPRERILLALSIGDDDLDLYVRTSGLDPATALQQLRARRAKQRPSHSRSADPYP